MGFKSVYQTLRELFPQVDIRLLKAVAIEHSKDPDSAVEYILTEVLPCTGDGANPPTSAVENNGKTVETRNASSSKLESISGNRAIPSSQNDGHNLKDDSLAFYDANDSDDHVSGNSKTALNVELGEAVIDLDGAVSVPAQDRKVDLCDNRTGDASSSTVDSGPEQPVLGNGQNISLGNGQNIPQDLNNGSLSCDLELAPVSDSLNEQPSEDCNSAECSVSTECAINDQKTSAASLIPQPKEAENGFNSFLDSEFDHEFPESNAIGAESETLLSTIMTRSGQICRVDLLEDIIEEAKNYKDTVCSAMESVVSLMEEVELQEKEAEQAKVASTRGGLDILEKVEEIKKMLIHAKEANDMHAGEVYGEKSILATEVKELQVRLLGLTDEKERSLSMLDEMRKSLEERLAIVEEQKRAAEKELFDKQEIAQRALADQELIMDKVVQESKLLQQEADENAKLRDFLVEKGRVVDVLQGEISIICQDVKLLKENFDNRLPLNKSLSLDQTSSRLQSSTSSVKSTASLKSLTSMRSVASLNRTTSLKSTASSRSNVSIRSTTSDGSDLGTYQINWPESPQKTSQQSSPKWQTNNGVVGKEHVTYESKTQKPLSDEDWELCDMN
ncbi:hypothetical protein RND81_05G058200 [Saponaria officinalis]|uniref:CUE domain-containing protein n=1 Tax=Saponaria officinalis TaxID=3572 RepID=A0AAW1KR16_SAPOF